MIRDTPALLFFIFCGHLVGCAVWETTNDVMLALIAACIVTSYLQRFMRRIGYQKLKMYRKRKGLKRAESRRIDSGSGRGDSDPR